MPSFHGGDAQSDGQVRFADPRRAEEDDVFGSLDEGQAAELADDFAVDGWLEVKVELVDGLHPTASARA